MTTLSIKDFSCIENADLKLLDVTIIIGPQASGKSVLSKLVYFMNEALDFGRLIYSDGMPNEGEYCNDIASRFKKWFPVEAWGKKKFEIRYSVGNLDLVIKRKAFSKKPSQNVRVTFSAAFTEIYSEVRERVSIIPKDPSDLSAVNTEQRWQVAKQLSAEFGKVSSDEFITQQYFIPAGRAYFTSIGKAMTAFEHSGFLDQPTIRFGRLFTNFREGRQFYWNHQKPDKEFDALRRATGEELVGGTINTGKEVDFVESRDGRKVPFNFLSSGQQEVLPLIVVLDAMAQQRVRSSQVTIEEPEAHLFPSAQGLLAGYLVQLLNKSVVRRLILTTHSPYFLAKINNLSKAGKIAAKGGKNLERRIASVVPQDRWIGPGKMAAYCIRDRQVRSIVDEDGLIAADYLDEASSLAASEFNSLLEVEYGKQK